MKPKPLSLLKIFTYLFFSLLAVSADSLIAQISQPMRFEIQKKANESYWNVVSAHEFGIAMFRENRRSDLGNKYWEVLMLDTDLNLKWEKEFPADRRNTFRGFDYSNNQLFLLFQEGSQDRGKYEIMRIQLANGNIKNFSVEHQVPLELEDFITVGESAVFGGYANGLPTVLMFNFAEDKFKVIPGLYRKNAYLLDISADEVNNTFSIVINERYSQQENNLTIKTFNSSGDILTDKQVSLDENINILSAKTTTFDWGEQVITGTFGERNSDFAKGVYFVRIQEQQESALLQYNFTELENYFNYLSGKQKERMDTRIEQLKAKGKELNVKSRIVLHELIPEGSEYIMLGEVYDVNFGTMNNSPYGTPYYMNNFNSGYRGYRVALPNAQSIDRPATFEYKQAIIIGFSQTGEIKWDNSLVLNELYVAYLNQMVHINTINNRSVLIYKDNSELIAIIFEKGGESSGTIEEIVKLKFEGDELRSEAKQFSGLSYWYEDNFFTWGYQRIRNKLDERAPKSRNVFYINKIKIR